MWQKARIIKSYSPEVVGRFIWTMGMPQSMPAFGCRTGHYLPPRPRLRVNIIPADPRCEYCCLETYRLELLPEFAEDVPMITWEEFLRD